ncbi:MAG: hypothetical protein RBR35_18380 [Salinivirgaceae bacterium]|nr:hypothetical protein [Salinivirgaceae bacterium]
MAKIEQKINQEAPQQKFDKLNKLRGQIYKALAGAIVSTMLLAGCVPGNGIIEVKPAITQAIDNPDPTPEEDTELGIDVVIVSPESSQTVIASPTLENTVPTAMATAEATAPQEATATPEKTEEERMHEYCIQRAKEVGIDLENFANSNNLWVTEHQGLASLEEAFNTSFTDDRTFKVMVVVGYDSLNSQSRYDKAPTTAEGKKIMSWLEAVYKKANGNYQLVLLPIQIWDIVSKIMYDKPPSFGGPRYATDINSKHSFNSLIKNGLYPDGEIYNPDWDNFSIYVMNYIVQNVWMGPGALISFNSDYPESGISPEKPSFNTKEHSQFQQTGDANFFPYFTIEPNTKLKQPFSYPFEDYGTLSRTDNYDVDQVFIEEVQNWYYNEMFNPTGQPYIRHWKTLP